MTPSKTTPDLRKIHPPLERAEETFEAASAELDRLRAEESMLCTALRETAGAERDVDAFIETLGSAKPDIPDLTATRAALDAVRARQAVARKALVRLRRDMETERGRAAKRAWREVAPAYREIATELLAAAEALGAVTDREHALRAELQRAGVAVDAPAVVRWREFRAGSTAGLGRLIRDLRAFTGAK